MANQPRRGFFGRMFGRGPAAPNSLTLGLKNAINRLNTATKNATTALTVNQVVAKMNNKGANGQSVTNIFKKTIANQFQKAHAAVVAAAAGRIPQTAAAKTVNTAATNIKNIVGKVSSNNYLAMQNRNINRNYAAFGTPVNGSTENIWWKNVLRKRTSRIFGIPNKIKVSNNNGKITANITKNANGVWTINNSQMRTAWKLNNNRNPTKLVALTGNVAV
jgi:hypothetical protein